MKHVGHVVAMALLIGGIYLLSPSMGWRPMAGLWLMLAGLEVVKYLKATDDADRPTS